MITWQLGGRPPRHPGPASFKGHPKEAYARPVRLEKSWNRCVPVQMHNAPLPAQRASTRRQNPRVDLSKLDVSRGIFSTSRSSSILCCPCPPCLDSGSSGFHSRPSRGDAAVVPCAGGPCLQPGTAPSCQKHHISSPVTSQQHNDRSQMFVAAGVVAAAVPEALQAGGGSARQLQGGAHARCRPPLSAPRARPFT